MSSEEEKSHGLFHHKEKTKKDYEKEIKHDKHKEHLGETVVASATAFALHEKIEEKKDHDHAGRHKIEEKVAEVVAVGAGGYVVHENNEKKEDKEEEDKALGKKHHHLF